MKVFVVALMCIGIVIASSVREFQDIEDDDYSYAYDEGDGTVTKGLGWWGGCKKIAFTAYLSRDLQLGKKQHVKFNKVVLNDGNAYNPTIGVFKAPCSGVYSFTVVIGQGGSQEVRVRLVLDGFNMVDVIAEGTRKYHDIQGTNTLNLHVKKGHSVYVETSGTGHVEGSSGDARFTTFSGHLVYDRS